MLILLIVATVGTCMIFYEYSRPGRNWPIVRGWWARWEADAVNEAKTIQGLAAAFTPKKAAVEV